MIAVSDGGGRDISSCVGVPAASPSRSRIAASDGTGRAVGTSGAIGAASGCIVDFTVSGDDFTTTSFTSNKWMFTDQRVFYNSKVSSDDGIWGGAPGEVNGDGTCRGSGGNSAFYGFGNCNSGDTTARTVYYGPAGTKSCPSLKAWVYA